MIWILATEFMHMYINLPKFNIRSYENSTWYSSLTFAIASFETSQALFRFDSVLRPELKINIYLSNWQKTYIEELF